ncbi:hypothetical protein Hanom_Chr11g01024491 [Helianthus anomalus]
MGAILRKLHIDGWKTNRINDEGLIGVSKYCVNLQDLVLISVDYTHVCLELRSETDGTGLRSAGDGGC